MPSSNVLALDVGTVRVGVAVATQGLSIPRPLTTLNRQNPTFWDEFEHILSSHGIEVVVVGLPRGLDGQDTSQTESTRVFAEEMAQHCTVPIAWQDEALTSVKAKETLQATQKPYNKADVDALAASYILADYIQEAKHDTA
jgi:putative Holliday junction resolvase